MADFRGMNLKNMPKIKSHGSQFSSLFVLGLIVALALISFGISIWSMRQKPIVEKLPNPQNNIVAPKITRALPAEIAEGFPKNLALNSKIEITESYSATYPNSSAKQATVEFISSKTPNANKNFYIQWAKDNGWDIVNSSEGDSISFLYFKKGFEQINITIRASVKDAKSSDIIISYVNLNK